MQCAWPTPRGLGSAAGGVDKVSVIRPSLPGPDASDGDRRSIDKQSTRVCARKCLSVLEIRIEDRGYPHSDRANYCDDELVFLIQGQRADVDRSISGSRAGRRRPCDQRFPMWTTPDGVSATFPER